jgi:hypothetical protein
LAVFLVVIMAAAIVASAPISATIIASMFKQATFFNRHL